MTVTLKPKTEIIVPKSIRRKAGIKPGDRFYFEVSSGVISIIPKPKRIIETNDTLTLEEARIVRRGEAQIKRGESKSWRDVKHALAR
jgi:AbrB family looped-hinge helix DNA binding protein